MHQPTVTDGVPVILGKARCHFGHCTQLIEVDGSILGVFGPAACPCGYLPGGHSPFPQGRPRPGVPALARGRHGSRVARSRRRHRLPRPVLERWYPPVSPGADRDD